MKLQHVRPGQEFILLRTGKRYKHYGLWPGRAYHVMVSPYNPDRTKCKTLHIACEVKVIEPEPQRKLRYPQATRATQPKEHA